VPGKVHAVFLAYGGLLVIAAAVLAVDLLVGAVLVLGLARGLTLARHGVETTGHVVSIVSRRPGGVSRVRIAYETAGGTLQTGGTSHRARIGELKTVRYDPARQARATTLIRPVRMAVTGLPAVTAIAALTFGMGAGSVLHFAGAGTRMQVPLAGGCFALLLALATGWFAGSRCAGLLRRQRLVQATGTVVPDRERGPDGAGVLITFDSGDGQAEFRAGPGTVAAGANGTVTVFYDPARPQQTATVLDPATVRTQAIASAVMTVFFAFLGAEAFLTLR
jgi:hypothetical protein